MNLTSGIKKILFFCLVILPCILTAQTTGKLRDSRDGKLYPTVKIGNQWWMSANLNFGTRIKGNTSQTNNGIIEKYCFNNLESNCDTLGALYQWNEMMNYTAFEMNQGICPAGWHVPSDNDWKELEIFLGMSAADADLTGFRGTDQGTQLKTGGTSGFNARLDGYMLTADDFVRYGTGNCFWTATDIYARYLLNTNTDVYRWNDPQKTFGLSLRCLMDEPFTETVSGLPQVRTSITKWCDYDNDGVMDLFLCGITTYPDGISDIYHNNGNGTFTALGTALEKVSGSADWADYDCDGYADLLLAGYYNSEYITRLYRNNNGTGSFINVATGIPGASLVRWGDYDCDGDPDILINQSDYTIEIYENKGTLDADLNLRTGIVFEKTETDFPSMQLASFDWGDYNNDGFPDIVIAGEDDIIHNKYCKIYRNNGNKTFTDLELMLRGASLGRVNWGDFDNDNDLDILLTGYTDDIQIYRNEGNDVFSYFNTQLVDNQVINAWFDFNNDGNLDVVLTGYDSSRVYSGDGQGYYKHLHCTLQNATSADLDIADYDNDGDIDFVYSGFIKTNNTYTGIYQNNTSVENHEPQVPTGLITRQVGSDVVFSWNASDDAENGERLSYNITAGTSSANCLIVSPLSKLTNGDRLKLNRGNVGNHTTWVLKDAPVGTLYWSVQSIDRTLKSSGFAPFRSFEVKPPFTEMTISPELSHLAIKGNKFIDINNDGLLDILTSTMNEEGMMNFADVHCYMNQGNNSYTPGTITGPALAGTILPCNLNGDAFMDALLVGKVYIEEFHAEMKAYSMINNQTNGFIVSTGDFASIILQDVPWNKSMNVTSGDLDNDGDEDIVFVGYKYDTLGTYLFRKEDAGYTIHDLGFLFYPQTQAMVTCDVDGDMDLDIVIGGSVLKNEDGFTRLDIFPFADVESMDWGDFDGDGDLDAALSGQDTIGNRISGIFENNGSLSFTALKYKIRGFSYSAHLRWLDYNNDGLLDLAASGTAGGSVTELYLNQGNSTFETIAFSGLQSFDWGDSDNDGDVDMLGGKALYVSNGNWTNAAPQAPSDLACTLDEFDAVLSWDKAVDDRGSNSLSYNVKVGNTTGLYNVMTVLTATDGKLRVPEAGNVQTGTTWRLKNLPPGDYHWSVQAVDEAYKGGPWAGESTFEIRDVFVDFLFDTVCLGDPTTFTDRSVSRTGEITSRHWDFDDDTESGQQNPVHVFSRSGIFNVKLTVTVNSNTYHRTRQVIVNPKPMVAFSFEPVSEGSDIMRFENQTDTSGIDVSEWKWDFGDGEVYYGKDPSPHGYLTTGRYTVKLSVSCTNGCSDSLSQEIQVCHGMLKKPLLRAYGPNLWYLVCSNDTARYYKWYYNGNRVQNKYTYVYIAGQNLGEYRIEISDDDECYVSSDKVVIPLNATLSDNFVAEDQICIYPNPAGDRVRIFFSHPYQGIIVTKILNMDGSAVKELEWQKNDVVLSEAIDLAGFGTGLYLLELMTDRFTYKTRIVIIK